MIRARSLILAAFVAAGTASAGQVDFIESSKTLDIEQLITWVQERNPDIGNLNAAIVEAESREIPAGALDDPQLTYALAPATLDGFRRPDGTAGGFNQRIELTQQIPWPGTLSLRETQAESLTSAAEFQLAGRRLELTEMAAAWFAEWYYVHQALAINAANQDVLLELKGIAESRYAAGRAGQQDVLRAEMKQSMLDAQRLNLERARLATRAQLNALLNRRADSSLPPPGPAPALEMPPPYSDLEMRVLNRHPELRRLEAELRSHSSGIALAEKRFYPDIRFMAGYNSLWDETQKQWTIGVSVNIPLDRDKYQAGLASARAKAMQTRWQLQDRRNRLLANLEQSRAEVLEAIGIVRLYRERLMPLADETLNAAVTDYQSGLGDFPGVIAAEAEKLSTELALERAHADYIRRLAALERWTSLPAGISAR